MSDAAALVYLDGVDLDTLSAAVVSMPGIFSGPSTSYSRISPPFFDGAITTSATPSVGTRQFPLSFYNRQSTNALAESTIQTIKDAVLERRVRLSFAHSTGRSYYGTCEMFDAAYHAEPIPGWADLRMTFICDDPYAVDDTWTEITANAAERVAIPLGTGPTKPYVLVVGAAAVITLTARDHKGNSLGTMTTTSVPTTDAWIIETVNGGFAWRAASAVHATDMGNLTAGYTFPSFSPRHGDRTNSSWPTLETSSGTLIVRYARRWR